MIVTYRGTSGIIEDEEDELINQEMRSNASTADTNMEAIDEQWIGFPCPPPPAPPYPPPPRAYDAEAHEESYKQQEVDKPMLDFETVVTYRTANGTEFIGIPKEFIWISFGIHSNFFGIPLDFLWNISCYTQSFSRYL